MKALERAINKKKSGDAENLSRKEISFHFPNDRQTAANADRSYFLWNDTLAVSRGFAGNGV